MKGKWIRVESPIFPDAVFDKVSGKYDYSLFELKQRMTQKFPVNNSPLFRTLLNNKLAQYLAFSKFMPTTYVAENKIQLEGAVVQIRTEKIVLKEVYGSGGKQVSITDKISAQKTALSFPLIIQEFIETSGIPKFSPKGSVADLRLVYVNNTFIYALSRIAKNGSLLTNFHQGAHVVFVPSKTIPRNCLELSEKIREKLKLFQKVSYSLDFMFDTMERPFFIEMNTTPGFDLLHMVTPPEVRQHYYEETLHSLFHATI